MLILMAIEREKISLYLFLFVMQFPYELNVLNLS